MCSGGSGANGKAQDGSIAGKSIANANFDEAEVPLVALLLPPCIGEQNNRVRCDAATYCGGERVLAGALARPGSEAVRPRSRLIPTAREPVPSVFPKRATTSPS